jgi:flavin-dependent dehydrogenase
MDKMDVVVVGGKLEGLSAAYRSAAAGRQVILLERGDAGRTGAIYAATSC